MNRVDAYGFRRSPLSCSISSPRRRPRRPGLIPALFLSRACVSSGRWGRDRRLLAVRDTLQAKIDDWHRAHKGKAFDMNAYPAFLRRKSGIFCRKPATQKVETSNVDEEIGKICGPQLVVPLTNARYALNAANARTRRFAGAFSATRSPRSGRGRQGLQQGARRQGDRKAKAFLDSRHCCRDRSPDAQPLCRQHLPKPTRSVRSGNATGAQKSATQFAGYQGDPSAPTAVLLVNGGTSKDRIDRSHVIGKDDPAEGRRHDPGIGGLDHPRQRRQLACSVLKARC